MNATTTLTALDRKLGLTPAGSPVAVLGLGLTGLSVVRFLNTLGFRILVADTRPDPPGLPELRNEFAHIPYRTGGFEALESSDASHWVVSPGVALETVEVRNATARGVTIIGDIDLFACAVQAPVVGITGSNGKSTVTSLVGAMALQAGRRAKTGGNLGIPALDLLDDSAELYVLELSSFQLERSHCLECAAATVLNISPDHLDRYPDLASYASAKARIFAGSGAMVLNRDDALVSAMAASNRQIHWFGVLENGATDFRIGTHQSELWLYARDVPLIAASTLKIRGRHNLANALAALALGEAVGLPMTAMLAALRDFPGLPHRMEWVAKLDGVDYVNDSKATNVGATEAALAGLTGKAVLIAGGEGKGQDFSPLAALAPGRLRAAVLMGKDAPALFSVLSSAVSTVRVENLRDAVSAARALARPGDTVLLAPACASLDQFKDYQERGRVFAAAVQELAS